MQRHLLTIATLLLPAAAVAQPLSISVENLADTDGFFLTPVWFGLHDGSFDLFDPGSAATLGLEELAEDGLLDNLQAEFAAPGRVQGVVANADGFGGAPIIDPGETATTLLPTMNPAAYQYFSFASMVIPSNDAFIGNGNPLAYQVFNAGGDFIGPITIDVFGSNIWDAGTEVNDTLGAAFSTIGGMSSDENGVVALHLGLADFEGTGTPAGSVALGAAPSSADLVARITITQIPEPTGLGLLSLAGLGLAGAGRRG
ncbi:MAG: spondin domain-containing protein [Planctomycetota bacterium]